MAVRGDDAAAHGGVQGSPRARGASVDEHRVYSRILERILDHRLPPGTKLPEIRLGTLFDVDRAVVRRALLRLAHEDVVELRPHRGAVVASPTRREAVAIFEVRRALERTAVEGLVARGTSTDLAALRSQLAEEANRLPAGGDGDNAAWARQAGRFHLELVRLCGNPVLERYLTELLSRCSLIVASHEAPGNASCEHAEHEAITRHIEAGDAAAAVAAMDRHLLDLEGRLEIQDGPIGDDLARRLGFCATP